jgi:hypothetical protein
MDESDPVKSVTSPLEGYPEELEGLTEKLCEVVGDSDKTQLYEDQRSDLRELSIDKGVVLEGGQSGGVFCKIEYRRGSSSRFVTVRQLYQDGPRTKINELYLSQEKDDDGNYRTYGAMMVISPFFDGYQEDFDFPSDIGAKTPDKYDEVHYKIGYGRGGLDDVEEMTPTGITAVKRRLEFALKSLSPQEKET